MWWKFYLPVNWSYYVQLALEMNTSPIEKEPLYTLLHIMKIEPRLPYRNINDLNSVFQVFMTVG